MADPSAEPKVEPKDVPASAGAKPAIPAGSVAGEKPDAAASSLAGTENTGKKPSFGRRKVLVDPELQIGLSTEMVGWIYVYFMLFALVANLPHLIALMTYSSEEAAYLAAMDHIRGFAGSVVLPMGITFVAMAVHGVYMTHRIAGPMVRFKRTMREIAARRLPRAIGLRTKDHFKDLADEINAAMAVLREDAVRRRRMADDSLATIRRLIKALEQPNSQSNGNLREMQNLAHAALDEVESLARHLNTGEPVDGKMDGNPIPLPDADLPAVVSVDIDDLDTEPPAPPPATLESLKRVPPATQASAAAAAPIAAPATPATPAAPVPAKETAVAQPKPEIAPSSAK